MCGRSAFEEYGMISYAVYAGLSAASPFLGNRKAFGYVFAAFLLLFIAFRFETGFDWPIYKLLFSQLQTEFTGWNTSCFVANYNQEYLFVGMLGGLATILPEYELAQAIFSVIFLASLFYIGKAFKLPNLAFFIAIALSYIVFTVGFSTVRQSLAIAAFNFAIVAYLNKRNYTSAALLIICVLLQYISIIYVFAFAVTVFTYRRFKIPIFDAAIFGVLCIGALGVSAVFLILAQSGLTLGSERIAYYVTVIAARGVKPWDLIFSVVLLGIAGHVLISIFYRERSESELFASRMMLILAAIAIGALLIPVVRERASYQMWIMYSVILACQITILRRLAIFTAFAFAAVCAVLVQFRYPNTLMFKPYQNYLLAKFSLAQYPPRQYDKFINEFVALTVPPEVQNPSETEKSEPPSGGEPALTGKTAVSHRKPC
jgi:hypothetical protein